MAGCSIRSPARTRAATPTPARRRCQRPGNGDNPAKCRPLWDAKQAGKRLVGTLYSGFDRVGVVGYDFNANVYSPLALDLGVRAVGGSDSTGVYAAIDSLVLQQRRSANG